jgi:hypothetical protein
MRISFWRSACGRQEGARTRLATITPTRTPSFHLLPPREVAERPLRDPASPVPASHVRPRHVHVGKSRLCWQAVQRRDVAVCRWTRPQIPPRSPPKRHLPSKAPSGALSAFWHRARLLVGLREYRALAGIVARCRVRGLLAAAAARQRQGKMPARWCAGTCSRCQAVAGPVSSPFGRALSTRGVAKAE